MLEVIKILKNIKNFFYKKIQSKKLLYKKSYSQCGEDLIIQYVFQLRGIKKPTYIDIGAHHPNKLSNTALFYDLGSQGINIEANPELMSAFLKMRTRDINLNIGIASVKGDTEFYIMKDNTLSTFSNIELNSLLNLGMELEKVLKVPILTINEILHNYCNNQFPDFLSLDVEGLDLDIIQDIDFNISSPKVICVEASEYSSTGSGEKNWKLINYLESKNYFEYANTNLNSIMVRKDFWFE